MAKKKRQTKTPAAAPVQKARALGGRSLLFALGGAAVLAIVAVIGVSVLLLSGSGGSTVANTGEKKAVIVDQLQLTQPGEDFVSDARATLAQAGYSVDYIPGDQVTVDTYRTLATRNYDLVILRVHAGLTSERDAQTGEISKESYVSLFTNEPFEENKYPDELNKLGKATYPDGSGGFFGIGPKFIEDIPGDFHGAPVILMGCDGLKSSKTAQAFLDHGASSFVSWSDQVSGKHTDDATAALLKHMLLEGMTVQDAVSQTAADIGPDPTYAGELRVLTG
jgi:hypothetical protein